MSFTQRRYPSLTLTATCCITPSYCFVRVAHQSARSPEMDNCSWGVKFSFFSLFSFFPSSSFSIFFIWQHLPLTQSSHVPIYLLGWSGGRQGSKRDRELKGWDGRDEGKWKHVTFTVYCDGEPCQHAYNVIHTLPKLVARNYHKLRRGPRVEQYLHRIPRKQRLRYSRDSAVPERNVFVLVLCFNCYSQSSSAYSFLNFYCVVFFYFRVFLMLRMCYYISYSSSLFSFFF